MIIPITLPVVVIILTGVAYFRRRSAGEMTDEHRKIYRAALSGALKDPQKMRQLADAFAGEGFIAQAKLLRQRARLRELPEDVKRARRQVFRDALKSTNELGIRHVADVYESEGCTAAAARLREYADGLKYRPTAASDNTQSSPETPPSPEASSSEETGSS